MNNPEVRIKIADASKLDAVHKLVYQAYIEEGYCAPNLEGRLNHYPQFDALPETKIWLAYVGRCLVGTNSRTIDSPAGLHVDDDFKDETDAVRAEGRKLASSWRIATKDCFVNQAVILALIEATMHDMISTGVETMLFTFNPKHERRYRRILNAKTIAKKDGTVGALQNAPAVLMRLDWEDLPERWMP